MRCKLAYLILLFGLQGYPWASEVVIQSTDTAQKPVATQEDVKSLRALIKKEFSVQSGTLKNELGELAQLKIQANSFNKSLNAIELEQSIMLNNLRFIGVFLCILFFLGAIWIWFSGRGMKAGADASTNEYAGSNSNIEADEGMAAPTFNNASDDNIISAAVDTPPETRINLDSLRVGETLITSIKIEKATSLFEEIAIQDNEMLSYSTSEAIAAILAKVKVIKLDGLERLKNPRPHTHLAPINLTMRPSAHLGSQRPLKSIVIRNKFFSTGVKGRPKKFEGSEG